METPFDLGVFVFKNMEFILILSIIFYLIHVWQLFSRGEWSPSISWLSFLVSLVLFFIYDWKLGVFIILTDLSWLALMKIFSFTTYHKYFFKIFLILILFGLLIGFLINKFFYDLYFYYLIIVFAMFLFNFKKQLQDISLMKQVYKDKESIKSFNDTIIFYLLSCFSFLIPLLVLFLIY